MKNLKQGQTIFEVLVGLTVIIFMLTGVVTIQLVALRNASFAKNKSQATFLARDQIEKLRIARDTMGLSNLVSLCGSGCYVNANLTPAAGTLTNNPAPFQIHSVFSSSSECPVPGGIPNAASYKVTSTVDWNQGAPITPEPEVVLTSCLTNWR
jgi:type II secretory pathway pseudopilin PulG